MSKFSFIILLFTLAIIIPPRIIKAQGPDYLDFIERVDVMTELVVSAKSCEGIGATIDWDSTKKISDELISYAIRNDIDVKTFAEPTILSALRKKQENEAFLVTHYKENPEKIDEFSEHWSKRCFKLSTHELTKKYINLEDIKNNNSDNK